MERIKEYVLFITSQPISKTIGLNIAIFDYNIIHNDILHFRILNGFSWN